MSLDGPVCATCMLLEQYCICETVCPAHPTGTKAHECPDWDFMVICNMPKSSFDRRRAKAERDAAYEALKWMAAHPTWLMTHSPPPAVAAALEQVRKDGKTVV